MVNAEDHARDRTGPAGTPAEPGISPNRLSPSAEFATESLEDRSAVLVGTDGVNDWIAIYWHNSRMPNED